MKYRATYNTSGTITVTVEVPDEVIEEFTDEDGLDESAVEDWVADHSHDLAEEHCQMWGIHQPVILDIGVDGIGADEVERVDG